VDEQTKDFLGEPCASAREKNDLNLAKAQSTQRFSVFFIRNQFNPICVPCASARTNMLFCTQGEYHLTTRIPST